MHDLHEILLVAMDNENPQFNDATQFISNIIFQNQIEFFESFLNLYNNQGISEKERFLAGIQIKNLLAKNTKNPSLSSAIHTTDLSPEILNAILTSSYQYWASTYDPLRSISVLLYSSIVLLNLPQLSQLSIVPQALGSIQSQSNSLVLSSIEFFTILSSEIDISTDVNTCLVQILSNKITLQSPPKLIQGSLDLLAQIIDDNEIFSDLSGALDNMKYWFQFYSIPNEDIKSSVLEFLYQYFSASIDLFEPFSELYMNALGEDLNNPNFALSNIPQTIFTHWRAVIYLYPNPEFGSTLISILLPFLNDLNPEEIDEEGNTTSSSALSLLHSIISIIKPCGKLFLEQFFSNFTPGESPQNDEIGLCCLYSFFDTFLDEAKEVQCTTQLILSALSSEYDGLQMAALSLLQMIKRYCSKFESFSPFFPILFQIVFSTQNLAILSNASFAIQHLILFNDFNEFQPFFEKIVSIFVPNQELSIPPEVAQHICHWFIFACSPNCTITLQVLDYIMALYESNLSSWRNSSIAHTLAVQVCHILSMMDKNNNFKEYQNFQNMYLLFFQSISAFDLIIPILPAFLILKLRPNFIEPARIEEQINELFSNLCNYLSSHFDQNPPVELVNSMLYVLFNLAPHFPNHPAFQQITEIIMNSIQNIHTESYSYLFSFFEFLFMIGGFIYITPYLNIVFQIYSRMFEQFKLFYSNDQTFLCKELLLSFNNLMKQLKSECPEEILANLLALVFSISSIENVEFWLFEYVKDIRTTLQTFYPNLLESPPILEFFSKIPDPDQPNSEE